MTENSKIPSSKKTIQDPPEYAAAAGKAAPSSSDVSVTGFGGEREATYQQNGQSEVNDRGRVPADDVTEKKAPKGSLTGEGEGARNPQTGERIARNPQAGE